MNLPELYSVITYLDDETHAEVDRYLFSSMYDVRQSINITWHKMMDAIDIVEGNEFGYLKVYGRESERLLVDCIKMQRTDVISGPTHF